MNLSAHFTLEEFVASDLARRRGLDNSLPEELKGNAIATALLFERIRSYLSLKAGREVPVLISSGYRCPALNMAVGSSSTSDHPRACAGDLKVPAFGTPFAVASALKEAVDELGIGQLIHEFGGWTHVSNRMVNDQKNRILTIDRLGTRIGIWEAR